MSFARYILRILCANDCYKAEQFSMFKAVKSSLELENTKVIFTGDFLGGSFLSENTRGELFIKIANAVGFDYVTLGNHEFDYGAARTKELIDLSNFFWLGSNVRFKENGVLFHKIIDTDTFNIGDLKVGIFGLCTQDTPTLSNPTQNTSEDCLVNFEDVLIHAARCVSILKHQNKCDVIIALTHVSLKSDKDIAEKIQHVDIIIGGHDHEPMYIIHNDVIIIKCGQDINHIGILDLNMGRDLDNKVDIHTSFQLKSTFGLPSDKAIDEIILAAKETIKQKNQVKDMNNNLYTNTIDNNEIICMINGPIPLSTRTCELRVRETAYACHVADAIVWSYRQRGYTCDFAFLNGGFVRNNRLYPIESGITRADVYEEMPFPKHPVLLCMKGSQVILALRQMLPGYPVAPTGSFPHLSADIAATFNASVAKPVQEALIVATNDEDKRLGNILVYGVPIDLNKNYNVAISDFYATSGGDGVTAFTQQELLCDHGLKIAEVMVEYLDHIKSISSMAPGRLLTIFTS